ncbi:MAG: class II fructose-bisphosphate aldolase [Acidobacteria bacterium]|nr:class II fructose-bisphosphate aldolase [Acidobacteriota bacterium]
MVFDSVKTMEEKLQNAVGFEGGKAILKDKLLLQGELTDSLIETAVFANEDSLKAKARHFIKLISNALNIKLASIHSLYSEIGRGNVRAMTVPAMNLRGLAYDSARAFYRAAKRLNCGAFIFEIAKSEMQYTSQKPNEYVASMLAAAIREGYEGFVFVQGDHFQANAKKYFEDKEKEIASLKKLIKESILAGFYNIDIDSSTLVQLEKPTVREQQKENSFVCAELTNFIREIEPQGISVSIGGEIGEVGGHNSTVEEFEAFMEEYIPLLKSGEPIKKISVQTGTSHGGVVLPDGTIAKVKLDFSVLENISKVAREKYKMGGTVQHGASTLPDEMFHKFKEHGAVEVHLATGFQNLIYDHPNLPYDLREKVYDYLLKNFSKERKEGETEEQFFYKIRKKGWGDPLKKDWWAIPSDAKEAIFQDLEDKFAFLIEQLGVNETSEIIKKVVSAPEIKTSYEDELKAITGGITLEVDTNPRAD